MNLNRFKVRCSFSLGGTARECTVDVWAIDPDEIASCPRLAQAAVTMQKSVLPGRDFKILQMRRAT